MKKSTCIVLFCAFFLSASASLEARRGKSGSISLANIPANINEFKALRSRMGKTPQSGAALFIAAMILYGKNAKQGLECFTYALDRSNLTRNRKLDSGLGPSMSFMYYIKQLNKRKYLGGAYIRGTSHKNAYRIPEGAPLKIDYVQFTVRGNRAKLYIKTTSGNRPRPLTLLRNNRGIWKVKYASSLFVGVMRRPAKTIDDNL